MAGETVLIQNASGSAVYKFTKKPGVIRCVERVVKLDGAKNHWYFRSAKDVETDRWVKRKVITATGLDYINQFIGISFVTPDWLVSDDGKKVENPQIVYSPNGLVERIRCRTIGIGRSQSGNLTAFDLTFVYSFIAYLGSDIYAKWCSTKDNKVTTKPWGRLVSDEGYVPDSTKKRFAVSSGIYLECDLSAPEVVSLIPKQLEEQKFADRRALSMARRNIIKAMTGLTYANDDSTVSVTCWPDSDRDWQSILDVISNHQQGKLIIEGETVEVTKASKVADEDDIESSVDEEVVEIDNSEPVSEESMEKFRTEARELVSKHGPKSDKVMAAFKSVGFRSAKDMALNGKAKDFKKLSDFLKG